MKTWSLRCRDAESNEDRLVSVDADTYPAAVTAAQTAGYSVIEEKPGETTRHEPHGWAWALAAYFLVSPAAAFVAAVVAFFIMRLGASERHASDTAFVVAVIAAIAVDWFGIKVAISGLRQTTRGQQLLCFLAISIGCVKVSLLLMGLFRSAF